jgi:hypothetical protein
MQGLKRRRSWRNKLECGDWSPLSFSIRIVARDVAGNLLLLKSKTTTSRRTPELALLPRDGSLAQGLERFLKLLDCCLHAIVIFGSHALLCLAEGLTRALYGFL